MVYTCTKCYNRFCKGTVEEIKDTDCGGILSALKNKDSCPMCRETL